MAERSINKSAGEAADKAADKAAGGAADKAAGGAEDTDKAADKLTNGPADKPEGANNTPGMICKKVLTYSTWGLCVLALLLGGMAGLLVWKIRSAPVNMAFARESLQKIINSKISDYHVETEQIFLHWPNLAGPVYLQLNGIRVTAVDNAEGAAAGPGSTAPGAGSAPGLEVASADIGLSRGALMIGRIHPVSVIVNGPALQLVRGAQGLSLFLRGQDVARSISQVSVAADPAPAPDSQWRKDLSRILAEIADHSATRFPFLLSLRRFEIRDAQIALRDQIIGASWYLTDSDLALMRVQEDLHAALSVSLPGGASAAAGLNAQAVYNAANKETALQVYLQDLEPQVFARLFAEAVIPEDMFRRQDIAVNGQVEALFDDVFNLNKGSARLHSSAGHFSFSGLYDDPVGFRNVSLNLSCTDCARAVDVTSFSAELGGVEMQLAASVAYSGEHIHAPVKLRLPSLPLDAIPPLFPKSELDGEAAKWLLRRMSGGRFHDIEGRAVVSAVRKDKAGESGAGWSLAVDDVHADFSFEGVTVRYDRNLQPAEQSRGTGYIEKDKIIIEDGSARISDVVAENIRLAFTDIDVPGGGLADAQMDVAGPLSSLLRYVSDEPIGFGLGIDTGKVGGTVDSRMKISFPTVRDLKKEDVKLHIDGVMRDVALPDIVRGLELRGGPLDLKVADGILNVRGAGALAGRAVDIDWMQYFDPAGKPFEMRVKASLGADTQLRRHFGVDLDAYIEGTVPVEVVYEDKGGGLESVSVSGDLAPAALKIGPFDYAKPAGVPGTVSLNASLRQDILEEINDLAIETADLSLSGARLFFEPATFRKDEEAGAVELRRGTLPAFALGKSAGSAEFEITPVNVLKVTARGPVFDAAPFLRDDKDKSADQDGGDEGMPVIASLKTPKMLTKAGRHIEDVKLYIETDRNGNVTQIEMDGHAGAGDVYLRLKPDQENKRYFRMEAGDAGAVLRAFDIHETMRGGKLLIYAEPAGPSDVPGLNNFTGQAQIKDFKVVDAPVLARLLGAMSLSGLDALMRNEGLSFSRLETDFTWNARPEGSRILFKDGRTSGSSLGLSFAGRLDRAAEKIDITGTIVPLSEINSILSDIPLIGDILTGGEGGGLIAATYTIKGPAKDPTVSVNPLSVLAPGFLRTILFEGGYEIDVPDDGARDAN